MAQEQSLIKELREALKLPGENSHSTGSFICAVDVNWHEFCHKLTMQLEVWEKIGMVTHLHLTDDHIRVEFDYDRYGPYCNLITSKNQFAKASGMFAIYQD